MKRRDLKNIKYAFKESSNLGLSDVSDPFASMPKASMEEVGNLIDNLVDQLRTKSEEGMRAEEASYNDLMSKSESEAIEEIGGYLSLAKLSYFGGKFNKFGGPVEDKMMEELRESNFGTTWVKAKSLHRFFMSDEESMAKKVCLWSVLKSTNLPLIFNIPLTVAALMDLKERGLFSVKGLQSGLQAGFHSAVLMEEWATAAPSVIPVIGGATATFIREVSQKIASLPLGASWFASFFGITKAWDGMEDLKECLEGSKAGKAGDKGVVERKIRSSILASGIALLDFVGMSLRGAAGTVGGPVGIAGEVVAQLLEGVPNIYILACLWNKWVSKYENEVRAEQGQITQDPDVPNFSEGRRERESVRVDKPIGGGRSGVMDTEMVLECPSCNKKIKKSKDTNKKFKCKECQVPLREVFAPKASIKYIKELVKVANSLDDKGLYREADVLDSLIFRSM